jgi:hypothetical protein
MVESQLDESQSEPALDRREIILNRALQAGIGGMAIISATGRVAAAKSASELGIIQALLRFQELARNISYILGPAFIVIGALFYLFSTRNQQRSARGHHWMYGGVILFGLAIALDHVLNLIAWIAP